MHVARKEEDESALKILTDKSSGNKPIETPRRRWEGNICMALKGISVNTMNWIDLTQYRDY